MDIFIFSIVCLCSYSIILFLAKRFYKKHRKQPQKGDSNNTNMEIRFDNTDFKAWQPLK